MTRAHKIAIVRLIIAALLGLSGSLCALYLWIHCRDTGAALASLAGAGLAAWIVSGVDD